MTEADMSGHGLLSRRNAIKLAAGAGVGLVSAFGSGAGQGSAAAQGAASPRGRIPNWTTELRQLAPNVYAYVQGGGPDNYKHFFPEGSQNQFDNTSVSNAGVIVGPDHMMAVDALSAPLHAKAFIAAATKATGKRFGRLVDTHHHGDHTGGNQFFLPAEIVAHPFCRDEVLRSIATRKPGERFQKREAWAEGTEERVPAPPVTTFTDKMTYHYGDIVVELLYLGIAHTWGDVLVYLPQHRILFAGDVSFSYVTPSAHNGHVTKWIEVLNKMMAMDVETIVPGHGPLHGKKELADLIEYFETIKREARKRFNAGMSVGQAAAEIDMGRFEAWTNPERNVRQVGRLYAEWNGTITPAFDSEGNNKAVEEYRSIRGAGRSSA